MQFQLKKLTLTNFMGFKKEVFDFSKNLTLVVGPNGSGKSSILEALALSFQIKERGNSVNTYIYKNAMTAQIELEAVWLNKPLSIVSIFSKKGRKITRTITYDNMVLENTAANNFLTKYFNEKSLIISFALQGNERFLTNSKMQNFKNFMELLQIDFNKEVTLVKNLIKNIKQDIATETAQLHNHEGALSYIEKQLENTKNKLTGMNESPTPINPQELETIEKLYDSKFYELKTILEKKGTFEKVQKSIKDLKNIIENDELNLQSIQKSLKDLNIPEEQDCKEIKEDFEKKKNQLEHIQLQINELQQNKNKISSKLDVETQRKKQISSGICPVCQQPVSSHTLQSNDEEISLLNQQLTQNECKNKELIECKNSSDEEIRSLKEKIQTMEKVNQQIPWMLKNKQTLEQNRNTLLDKIDQNKKRKNDLEQQLSSISFEGVDTLEKEIEELKIKKAEISQRNKAWENFNTEKINLEKSLQEQTLQAQTVEKEKNDCSVKITELEHSLNSHINVQQLFENIPKVHTQHVVRELEGLMDASAKLFGYAGIRIEMNDEGLDFFLIKQSEGEDFQIEIPYHMCSSFQKNLINISCVLAFCTLFDVPFICIDELDANADKNNTLKLSPLISSMVIKAPVVSVTHSEALASELLKTGEEVAILKLKKDLIKQSSYENEEF